MEIISNDVYMRYLVSTFRVRDMNDIPVICENVDLL